MSIEVKVLEPEDAAVLERVAADVFDDQIDARRMEEFRADPRHHLAVAVDGGVVVGFVSAVHYVHPDKPRPELWINEVSVAETHRRHGRGIQLLQCVLDLARGLGFGEAWVLTERENEAAMRLYSTAAGPEAPTDSVMFDFPLDEDPTQPPE
jgi:GNAT superfamily N-acetyltransferase